MNSQSVAVFLLSLFAVLPASRAQAPSAESPLVAQARELVDTYYGNQNDLIKSAQLLERAYKQNPNDANVFVQAARVTAMGGHLGFDNYRKGTFERYEALLDRAIALDDRNATAHRLKSQVFNRQKRFADQYAELEKAKALGSKDPWLQIDYADYYENVNQGNRSLQAYSEVERRGPGSTASEREAYVRAIRNISKFVFVGEDPLKKMKKYSAIAMKERYPTDAWTPHGIAENFIDLQDFDDAIFYAREALKTMNFGAGRLTLAASLYAKAAQSTMKGDRPEDIEHLVKEAKAFGFRKGDILEYLLDQRGLNGSLNILKPTLTRIVQ